MAVLEIIWAAQWYILVLAVTAYSVRLYRQHERLKAFKGPFGTSISSFWMIKAIASKRTHLEYARVNDRYGSLARIGPNQLITSSPELLIRMNQARSHYTKGKWYKGMRIQPGHDNVFSQTDEKRHIARRAQMAPGYSGKENPSLEGSIETHIQNYIRLIRSKYLSTPKQFRPMDLARKTHYFTLDVITDIAFGQPFGDLLADEDLHKYIESTEAMLQVIITLGSIPVLSDILAIKWVGDLAFSDKDETGIGKLIVIAKELISDRFGPNAITRPDMLNSFIRHGVSQSDLVAESLIQILAGSDTSATVIRATLLYLMTHPTAYRALQDEIDAAIRAGRISNPAKDAEARELPYLQAVIKEGMRIWPPMTGLLTKVVPPEGDSVVVDGRTVFLPGGTGVGYCAWGVHHNKDVFGEDADDFRPERWLEAEGEQGTRMLRTIELVWGYGKSQCLGKNVAMIELNKVFVELLRNFDFSLVNPAEPWKSLNVGLWIQTDEWVRITERNH